ncbi:type II toxin-antitoxin system VapC family toxin [Belliella sp. DSM 107340]|uniref:Type II toxin-antitoxin system VapC family toxin n=1 Tax=Belliella calami TaxID=2923436 RepID=A0ABS9UKV6_9BACT|nr:type II toxin-antitoxin system VapC family toxin [Belliella calami]MCH7397262.1 type II toxin-antitoxin system VapC family toxin [Belliella calami]
MEKRVICLDTSVLLDFFRKKNKEKTFLSRLFNQYDGIEITSITEFEIKYGINEKQSGFWEEIFSKLTILPFDSESATIAVKIHQELKKINKQIDIPDLFIAATALRYKRPLASFNKKHFERVKRLELLIPENNE